MKIRIDSSKCSSVIQGWSRFSNGMEDYWYYSDQLFETGKSYGLISEYMQGCMYLSYLLGGKIKPEDNLEIYIDDRKILVGISNLIMKNTKIWLSKRLSKMG